MLKARQQYVDSAKGLGIILVMMSHSCGFPFFGGIINAYYMALFFILSGYTFKKSDRIKQDIIKREKKVVKAYFLYSTIGMTIWFITILGTEQFTIYNFVRNIGSMLYSRAWLFRGEVAKNLFFSVGAKFPLWFFTSMATALPIFGLIVYFIPRAKNTKTFILTTMASLLIITGLLSYLPILLPWSLDMAFFSAFCMLVGYILGQNQFFERLKGKWWFLTFAVSAIIYVVFYYFDPNTGYSIGMLGDYGGLSAFSFAAQNVFGSIVAIMLCKLTDKNIIGKILSLVGNHTIIIFGLHLFCFDAIANIFGRFGISPTVHGIIRISDILTIIITTVALIGIEMIFNKVVFRLKEKQAIR